MHLVGSQSILYLGQLSISISFLERPAKQNCQRLCLHSRAAHNFVKQFQYQYWVMGSRVSRLSVLLSQSSPTSHHKSCSSANPSINKWFQNQHSHVDRIFLLSSSICTSLATLQSSQYLHLVLVSVFGRVVLG